MQLAIRSKVGGFSPRTVCVNKSQVSFCKSVCTPHIFLCPRAVPYAFLKNTRMHIRDLAAVTNKRAFPRQHFGLE